MGSVGSKRKELTKNCERDYVSSGKANISESIKECQRVLVVSSYEIKEPNTKNDSKVKSFVNLIL